MGTEIATLAPLGIGGVLAYAMFMVYRKDAKEWAAKWHEQTKLLMEVVKENTAAMTELITYVRRLPPVNCPLRSDGMLRPESERLIR